MVLRLIYQVKKIADGSSDLEMEDLSGDWFTCLFEVNSEDMDYYQICFLTNV